MDMNFEELKKMFSSAASFEPTATLDVLTTLKQFEGTQMVMKETLEQFNKLDAELADAPADIRMHIITKQDLVRRIYAQYTNVVNSIKGLVPLMQELDCAGLEAKEKAKEFLEGMGDLD